MFTFARGHLETDVRHKAYMELLFCGLTIYYQSILDFLFKKKFKRSTDIHITDSIRTSPTNALFVILNWLPTVLLAKQAPI